MRHATPLTIRIRGPHTYEGGRGANESITSCIRLVPTPRPRSWIAGCPCPTGFLTRITAILTMRRSVPQFGCKGRIRRPRGCNPHLSLGEERRNYFELKLWIFHVSISYSFIKSNFYKPDLASSSFKFQISFRSSWSSAKGQQNGFFLSINQNKKYRDFTSLEPQNGKIISISYLFSNVVIPFSDVWWT